MHFTYVRALRVRTVTNFHGMYECHICRWQMVKCRLHGTYVRISVVCMDQYSTSFTVDMVSNVESDKVRKEKLRRCRECDTLRRERKGMKPHLQSPKVEVLVSPYCHMCDNALAFSFTYIACMMAIYIRKMKV